MLRYCTRCVLPDTKPDLQLDRAGICSACRSYETRGAVDYDARAGKLCAILEHYRNDSGYDCIVPSSGGKDSTYQALRIREMGFNPLLVTATTDMLTGIGRRNLENLKRLGFDTIEVTTNPVVRRKLNRFALTTVGDISWPEHVTIFTVPVRVAVQMGIPLIVWGENPQHEYGGPAAAADDSTLTRAWLEEFGGLLGLRVSDLHDLLGLKPRELVQYHYPSDEDLRRVGVTGLFLGYYLPWDGYGNALYAQAHGLETYPKTVEGSLVNYENLDNAQTGIHDYFKWLKFGFGRASDIASSHVRRGRLSRADAMRLVRQHDGQFPDSYLGVALEDVLTDIDMTRAEFVEVCDRFTNRKLFTCDAGGMLVKDRRGNLKKANYDNP